MHKISKNRRPIFCLRFRIDFTWCMGISFHDMYNCLPFVLPLITGDDDPALLEDAFDEFDNDFDAADTNTDDYIDAEEAKNFLQEIQENEDPGYPGYPGYQG